MQDEGDPSDGALPQHGLELRVLLQHPAQHHLRQDLIQLDGRDGRRSGLDATARGFLPLGAPLAAAHVEVDGEPRLLRRAPQGVPHLVKQPLLRVEGLELHALQAQLGAVVQLLHRRFNIVDRQEPQPKQPLGRGAAKLGGPLVVGPYEHGVQILIPQLNPAFSPP